MIVGTGIQQTSLPPPTLSPAFLPPPRSPRSLSLSRSLGVIASPTRGANQPILNKMTDEQEADKVVWTPSTMIERLGREIDNEESIYYWCAKVGT